MEGSSSSTAAVPEWVMDSVRSNARHLEQIAAELPEFLAMCSDPDLPSIQRAQSLLLLSKLTTTLFTVRLRCSGLYDEDHRVNTELDRLKLYREKVQRVVDSSKAPLRPSTILNYQAASRFIEHSLPDLTEEQRRSMREVSKGEGRKMKHSERNAQKKRKFQSPNAQSVQSAAKEFLEKAARDLLGDDNGGIKGPLRARLSHEENPSFE